MRKNKLHNMTPKHTVIKDCIYKSKSREEIWIKFIKTQKIESVAEIGIYRGDFAARVLQEVDFLKLYYMIDPWRNLENWNKPANIDDGTFSVFYDDTIKKTDFAKNKRRVLRGKTTEVINEIADASIDFAYIDGDHTLKGIAIDLISMYPKVKYGGWIGGDDLCKSIWQHPTNFEPTLVFPFVIYFAEAISARIYALPYNQFLIEKTRNTAYEFIDLTGDYSDVSLKVNLLVKLL
jgi:hypothetical protein